jgi:hypothetical protein
MTYLFLPFLNSQRKPLTSEKSRDTPHLTKTVLVDEEGFEPSTSAMPTLRSFQTDLLALSVHLHRTEPIKFLSIVLAAADTLSVVKGF